MIKPKTHQELDAMRRGGSILDTVLRQAYAFIHLGQTLIEIDRFIADTIYTQGARPSFLGYHGFPAASCLSVNNVVVHGIPNDYRIQEGDILGVDVGIKYDTMYTDAAFTMPIGKISALKHNLLAVTQAALEIGVECATTNHRVGDIGEGIENYVKKQGNFGIVRDLAGHGIGQKLQEPPQILNVKNRNHTRLITGMTIAIEPMITTGSWEVEIDNDGWSVHTIDGSASAQFETTVVVKSHHAEVLIPFPLEIRF